MVDIRMGKEPGGEIDLRHLLKQDEVHWERPLSCSGNVMAKDGDNGEIDTCKKSITSKSYNCDEEKIH